MKSSPKLIYLLFATIILEGYIVLATELLAIRLIIPYVGSGTDTVSIVIAAVLMPLAFGYNAGGRFREKSFQIRRKLVRNILIASFFLFAGLSYIGVDSFFNTLLQHGVTNRLLLTGIYASLFLVVPVFLLGQTVPLVSNYFSSRKLSQITGKMLFVSTVGSFFGSVISTIILMHYFGVNNTANTVFFLLGTLIFILSKKKISEANLVMSVFVVVMLTLNSTSILGEAHIVANNAYNTITVHEDAKGRYFGMNNSQSSMIGVNGARYPYIEYIEAHYLKPIEEKDIAPKNILVVGAAGFTFGIKDTYNHYTFVDIDPDMQAIAEKHFLEGKLTPNKKFVGEDIRAFITTNKDKYDLILLDAYSGRMVIPETLLTQNFFSQVKGAMAQNGILLANFIVSANFNDVFSQRLDNTFRSAFPQYSRQMIDDKHNGWSHGGDGDLFNVIYVVQNHPNSDGKSIYTDNHNTVSYDRPNEVLPTKRK